MTKVIVLLVVLLVLAGGFVGLQWNAAIGTEQDAYARSATPETAHLYAEWAGGLKDAPSMHHRLLDQFGPLKAHLAERKSADEAFEAELAAKKAEAEAAAKKAAEAEAAKNALTPEQRRAKWVEEYQVSAAAIPEGMRTAMTALLTRAAAEQRSVPVEIAVGSEVSEAVLKKALEGLDPAGHCKWDVRATPAFVELAGGGSPAVEGIRVRLTWFETKEPLDIEVHEKGAKKKKDLKLAKVRVGLDLRSPNAQPIHVEQEAGIDTGDFAKRIKKNPTVADVYSAEATSLGETACAKVSAMLGLRDP